MQLEHLSKEDLIKLCRMHAKNWLAHDGCWFISIEEGLGLESAMEFDKKAWEKFTVIEAKRIMEEFGIEQGGGLSALEKALSYRLYATVNRQTIERRGDRLIFRMNECRVQQARERKKLPDFPCKEIGLIEYSLFAKTIDPRIKTACTICPPGERPKDIYCEWEFSL